MGDGLEEPLLVRADPGHRQTLGREQDPGELCEIVRLDGFDLGDDPVEREQLRVGDQRLAEPAHTIPRRLHREDDAALQVLLCARDLVGAEVSCGDVGQLGGGDLEARREVLLARPDVEADEPGVRVLGREAVDGVRHAPLLTDLLEQPRRGGAAEDRVEQRGREAAPVRARDAGRAHADVVLLGVLALEAQAGRRC